MLYKEIIAACYEICRKHINILCGQNVEFFNVKPDGTYSEHLASNGYAFYSTRARVWLVWQDPHPPAVCFYMKNWFLNRQTTEIPKQ